VRTELLVNATPPETRVALLEDGRVVEVLHERRGKSGLVGNVYLGRVHRVLPGMQAAFVSIGLERDAFLYVEDVAPRSPEFDFGDVTETAGAGGAEAGDVSREERPRIDDLLKEGQEIVVQVTKDPMGGKGPRVTAGISLPGRALVYLPSVREFGISRRITDAEERERLRRILESLPAEGGFIARTAAQSMREEDFQSDVRYLTELSARITRRRESVSAPALLHRELDLAARSVRDLAGPDCAVLRVDDEGAYGRLKELLEAIGPSLAARLERFDRPEPIFEFFGVETEIENALRSRVTLPSGGSLVIHQTEALVAIDVNTGRFVGKDALEDTVFAVNLEAAPEIARQIRLRDLGGLLVVDFIDMELPEHRAEVVARFEEELAKDRARTRVLPLSEFGLIEVTRQRSRGNIERLLTRACPVCSGSGRVKTDLTLALDLRRELFAPPRLFTPGQTVRVRVQPSLAKLLTEEEPRILSEAQESLGVDFELMSDESVAGYEVLRD
jgi:ribonuclease G